MLGVSFFGAEIGIGDTRDEVLRQLGQPTSVARRGGHEILLFAPGGRVEIVDGRVADVKGLLPAPIDPATNSAAPTAASPIMDPPRPPSATKSQPPIPASAEAPPVLADRPPEDYNPAVAANELAKHVEKMDTAWGTAPPQEGSLSPLDSPASFFTGLLLRFVITILALKLAFKYWEMDAFWTGTLLIAGIDMTLHAMFELLGPASGGITTNFAVENGIPGLVMIYTVHRFCFNKRIQNAVLTAAAVKVVVTMLYVFAGVAALNMIYT
jgi:F0F1-type ATP synthase assembly protein I